MSERIGAEIDEIRRKAQATVQRYCGSVDKARSRFLNYRDTGTKQSRAELERLGGDLDRKREDLHRSMIALRAGMVVAGVNEEFATEAIRRGGYNLADRTFVIYRKEPLAAFKSIDKTR